MKRARDPTPEEFEKLLAWLGPDRDEAGTKLTQIQARLLRIFICRGCIDAESLADEVLNRVAVRIDEVGRTYSDPIRCCVGFSDYVFREYLREQWQINTASEPLPPRPSEELEKEDSCLRQCLEQLPKAERDLFVTYFQGQKRERINARKKLALDLGLTPNALRIHAFHIRKKLRQWMEICLDEE